MAVILALASGISAAGLAGQQPTRPDTTRRIAPDTTRRPAPDTGVAVRDTGALARDTSRVPRDTTPPPQLPHFPRPVPAGFSTGVWVFDRAAIERLGSAITLADLLETIPGITRLRSGYFVQPDAVSALGQTAGRMQVFLNGYELSPLSSGVLDLSRFALAEVAEVRVERGLGALRVEMRSFSPSTPQPYAYISALIAEPNSKLFRGVFLVPHFLFGPVAFGVERLDTDGTHRREPANEFTAWGKWSRIWRNKGGVQAEYRTTTVHRDPAQPSTDVPWVGGYARSDWVVRGRWQFVPGLTAEAYFGSASVKDRSLFLPDSGGMAIPRPTPAVPPLPGPVDTTGLPLDSVARDTALQRLRQDSAAKVLARNQALQLARDTVLDTSDRQIGARLGLVRGPFWGEAALRTHSAAFLPRTEGDGTAGLAVPGVGDVDGTLHLEKWSARQVTDTRLRGRLGPRAGLSAFAELSSGQRGIGPFLADTMLHRDSLFTKRSAWRLGVDLDRSWLSAGIARVSVTTDSMPGLGLPFDPSSRFLRSGSMQGWESHGRLQLIWKPLSAEYWYLAWTQFNFPAPDTTGGALFPLQTVYVPKQQWRASLTYHQTPLASGHLELYARLDAHSRDVMWESVSSAAAPAFSTAAAVPAITGIDFYLQIRILDLRIYFEDRNMMQNTTDHVTDLPLLYGRDIASPRILYGVRWQFFD